MPEGSAIATLAGALAIALALGWTTGRLGLSTLVGYMLAGIVVGPYTPGFVADPRLAAQLALLGRHDEAAAPAGEGQQRPRPYPPGSDRSEGMGAARDGRHATHVSVDSWT